jgi:4-amino-4-deoxy-L-arabinose transferase-like glycosyltransferase
LREKTPNRHKFAPPLLHYLWERGSGGEVRRDPHAAHHSSLLLLLFTATLLLAAFLRLTALNEAPPGLQHDEMFKALEGRRLLEAGDFRVFYPSNQGHEGGYVWALALSMAQLGVNTLSIKFPAFVFGMLTVALTIRLAGKLAGIRAAAIAGGLCAVSFFALFTSRVGLRAVMLPVFVLWLLLALYELTEHSHQRKSSLDRYKPAISAGLALGLGIYTYTSAFALWGGIAALILALLAFDRPKLRTLWRPLLLTVVIGAVLSVPMLLARATDPEGFNRSSTITRPLTDALAGRPQELLENGVKLLGMAAFTGDPEARYNIPDRPFFPLPVGLLSYAGLALIIWRVRRQPIYAALLGIMAAGLLPSLLTVSAPSFLRSIALLPCLMLCVALALSRLPWRVGVGGGVAVIALVGILDIRAYFLEWPRLQEVHAIYRDDFEHLARIVRTDDGLWLVSTPDVEQDYLTFTLIAGDAASRVAFFDGDTTVAFKDGARLAISPLSPLTPPHQPFASETLGAQAETPIVRQDGELAYQVLRMERSDTRDERLTEAATGAYLWNEPLFEGGVLNNWAAPIRFPIEFGGAIRLIGVELADRVIATEFDGVNLQLIVQPLVKRPDTPLGIFVHVYRQKNSRLHAQRDLMGMPPSQWLPEITFMQDNFVVMGPTRPGWYIVVMGVYNVITGERLPVLSESGDILGDRILIGRVRVEE